MITHETKVVEFSEYSRRTEYQQKFIEQLREVEEYIYQIDLYYSYAWGVENVYEGRHGVLYAIPREPLDDDPYKGGI